MVLYGMKAVAGSHHLPISSVPADLFQITRLFSTELVSQKRHNLEIVLLSCKNGIFVSQRQGCDGPQNKSLAN